MGRAISETKFLQTFSNFFVLSSSLLAIQVFEKRHTLPQV